MVRRKGGSDKYAVGAVKRYLEELGEPNVLIQTDGESALNDVMRQALAGYGGRAEMTETPRDTRAATEESRGSTALCTR